MAGGGEALKDRPAKIGECPTSRHFTSAGEYPTSRSHHAFPLHLQGLRHPRHRRRHAHGRRRPLRRSCSRIGSEAPGPEGLRDRSRRAPVRAGVRDRPRRGHPVRRARRRRPRDGHDADDVLRRGAPRHEVRGHGHRQPQSARLQRPEDGRRRRCDPRRCHPGALSAGRRRPFRKRGGIVFDARHPRGLPRPHRRRRQARIAAEDRHRLRQRRRRSVRAGALPTDGVRRRRAVLRGRRQFPEPSSRSGAPREPRGPDARARHRRRGGRPRVRRRRRPARRRHEGRSGHLPGSPADAVRRRRALAQSGRRDHLRRQVLAQPRTVGRAARWSPADVEDRATR